VAQQQPSPPSPSPSWRIVQLVPAEPGWVASYRLTFQRDELPWHEPQEHAVVAWALRESAAGLQEVVGLIAAGRDTGRLVAAVDLVEPGEGVTYREPREAPER
jgi:hypothetical protein